MRYGITEQQVRKIDMEMGTLGNEIFWKRAYLFWRKY